MGFPSWSSVEKFGALSPSFVVLLVPIIFYFALDCSVKHFNFLIWFLAIEVDQRKLFEWDKKRTKKKLETES
jgi:hypothetical protein